MIGLCDCEKIEHGLLGEGGTLGQEGGDYLKNLKGWLHDSTSIAELRVVGRLQNVNSKLVN